MKFGPNPHQKENDKYSGYRKDPFVSLRLEMCNSATGVKGAPKKVQLTPSSPLMDQLRSRIQRGENFEDLCRELSIGETMKPIYFAALEAEGPQKT